MNKFKNLFFVAAIVCIAFLSSCSVTVPIAATSNPVGSKVGVAKTSQVFGFFFDGGDASIRTAAKNGGITKISTVDLRHSVGFLSKSYETIVTGE